MDTVRPVLIPVLLIAFAYPLHAQHAPRSAGSVSLGEGVSQRSGRSAPVAVGTVSDNGFRNETDPIFWLGGGLGLGTYGGVGGFSGLVEVGRQAGSHVLLARRATTPGFLDGVSDFGMLYGRSRNGVAALAGVGIAEGPVQGPLGVRPNNFSPTPGLALQARWRVGTLGPLGLALEGFANLNSEASFCGVTVTLEIGGF